MHEGRADLFNLGFGARYRHFTGDPAGLGAMSEQPDPEQSSPPHSADGDSGRDPQRLGPRPLDRPSVDPSSATVFGRPSGIAGPFSPQPGGAPGARAAFSGMKVAPPTPDALVSAFGRPEGSHGVVLQRPPTESGESESEEDSALWTSGDGDPWRDPAAGAVIGPPALGADAGREKKTKRQPGQLLSLPEVLFGRRVKPTTLVVLAVIALLIGAAGGLAGWFVARGGNPLTSDVTLSPVQPGKERPAGSVSDIAKRVRPAVVSLEVRIDQGGGTGSGAVIDSQGYIITNDHVVTLAGRATQGQKITVVFNDGQRAEAKLVGRDPKTDLAVIKVDVTNPTVIQLGRSGDLEVGDTVIAIGSPLNLSDTVTEGIVSALHRPVVAGGEGGEPAFYDAIQTDAAVNQGNSGGPLVDSTGALVGINSSIRPAEGSTGSVGLGFAIPIDDARGIAEALIRDGKVTHADLGVNAASVSAETAEGARVQNVRDGSAAANAGIAENDVITKVGQRTVRDAIELIVAVRQHRPGETVPIVLARQGRQLEIQVTLQSD